MKVITLWDFDFCKQEVYVYGVGNIWMKQIV
jgi:hypothetical protein